MSSHSNDVVRELIQSELENKGIENVQEESEDEHFHTSINDTTYEQIKGVPECNFQDSDEQYEEIQLTRNTNAENPLKEHSYANIFKVYQYLE